MLKKEARQIYKAKRKAISSSEKMKLDGLLLIEFQKIPISFLSNVLSFYPALENNEPDTFNITRYLNFRNPGLQIAYPKTDLLSNSMQAIICEDEEVFKKNSFHIYEPVSCESLDPKEIDLVLVPLLAFEKKGFRVGYGKGFYDRYLLQCKKECIKIGLSYFEPLDALDDADEFDVPLDFCITPQKVYVF